jgi:hypothetical protein
MIERLVIHRFRGIREGVLDDLGKVNLLIGPNNSGKTAILELLYLGGTSGRSCGLILENVQDGTFQATASLPQDFLGYEPLPRLRQRHGHKDRWDESPATLTAEGGLAITLPDLPDMYPLRDFRLGAPLPEPGQKDKAAFHKKDLSAVALFSLDRQEGIPSTMVPPEFAEYHIQSETSRWHYLWQPEWVYKWERQELIDLLVVWAEEGTSPEARFVFLFDFHSVNAHFTRSFAQWAKNTVPDWPEQISEALGCALPEVKGATIEIDDAPNGQEGESGYVRFPGRTRLPIDQFGDGTRHAFKVLTSLIALCSVVDEEHPGLFLWEDPELFMHPATLGRLLDVVTGIVAERPVQVFITTQSLESIVWLVKYLETDSAIKPDDIRTFRLGLADGRLNVHKFVGKGISGWVQFFGDPRFIEEDEMSSPLAYLFRHLEEAE